MALILIFIFEWVFSSELFLPAPVAVLDNEGSVSSVLSQDTTQRLKNVLSSRSREAHDLSSQRVIFLSLRPGRQKPLREGERRGGDSLLSRGPGGEGTSLVFGQREECASRGGPKGHLPYRGPPFFTFTLLAIIIRMLWLHSLTRTARACLEIFHETFST